MLNKNTAAPRHGGPERRRTRRKRRSLRTRLVIAFVVQLLVVVGAIGYLTFTESEESFRVLWSLDIKVKTP